MPLLHKKPFEPKGIPVNLRQNDSVFFCKLTKEMFTDYDEFCERIILCNSLVWSCSLTGRSNLTYQEAASSEDKTKRLLKKFPLVLRVPVLFLASLCERRSLVDLSEDVYTFVKDRFFIGENALLSIGENKEVSCKIAAVFPPSEESLEEYPRTDHDKNGERQHWPPGHLYKYEVELEENEMKEIVSGQQLSRKKTSYSKVINRLYIKQFVHVEDGFWRLKNAVMVRYGISDVKFSDIFCGEPPVLTPKSPKKAKNSGCRQQTLNKYFKPSPDKKYSMSPNKNKVQKKSDGVPSKLNGVKQRRRRRTKAEMMEAMKCKPNVLEAKQRAKLEKKEEKLKQARLLKEWNRKREDLECEDLRELPAPIPVTCRIPHAFFGDAIMVMEFLHNFRKLVPVKDFFPFGVSLELIERALVDDEIAGPFSDLVQLLLVSVYNLMEQENEEIKETDFKMTATNLNLDKGVKSTQEIVRLANSAFAWVKLHHGAPIGQLTLDNCTLTEILRLHLLTSGSKPNDKTQKWRYQVRGGYCNHDDPAVHFKLSHPYILQQLSQFSVCQLPIEDKVAIVNCLVNQILSYSSIRDTIDENCDIEKQCRIKLRAMNAAKIRKEKELQKKQKEGEEVSTTPAVNGEEEPSRSLRGKTPPEISNKEEILDKMSKATASAHLTPLGRDRAFRKFWVFSSLPGLYVEHFEDNPGPCLPKGTPVCNDEALESIRNLFESGGANKENLDRMITYPYYSHHSSPSKKLLTESNGAHPHLAASRPSIVKNEMNRLTCWGDEKICPVHCLSETHTRWSFYKESSELDSLIESLNRRGIREKHLRLTLIREKENIINSLPRVPLDKLSPSHEDDDNLESKGKPISKVAKHYENANMTYPSDTSHDVILENLLRDLILETEMKINAGGLGSLKVKNRKTWRAAIEENGYDKQCKKLIWGGKFIAKNNENVKKEDTSSEDGSSKNDSESRCSTPTLELNLPGQETTIMDEEAKPRPVILDLGSAILQVAQCIENKYLKRPLGLDQKEKDKGEIKMPTPAMERWECSLMESTSFPQLFLHLYTLENSVLWARSALNAYCRICRKKSDPENMLLCDTCDKGHHLYCLKPKLSKIPSGDWHCPTCRPKDINISPVKKRRRMFSENSDESESDSEPEPRPCKICSENGSELECGTCETLYHLSCVVPPVRKAPKSKWFCYDCRRVANGQTPTQPKKEKSSRPATPEGDERLTSTVTAQQSEAIDKPKPRRRTPPQASVMQFSLSSPDGERTSRRKSSKAASQRIHKFAKQLRYGSTWDDNEEDEEQEEEEEEKEEPVKNGRRRPSRRTLDSQQAGLPLDNAALQEILETIMHDPDAWPFLRPVTKSEVPDYHLVIKKPMDFGTIKHKLNMLEYTKNGELISDAELLFKNCYEYNEEGSEVYRAGEKLEKLFKKLCEESNLYIPPDNIKRQRIA